MATSYQDKIKIYHQILSRKGITPIAVKSIDPYKLRAKSVYLIPEDFKDHCKSDFVNAFFDIWRTTSGSTVQGVESVSDVQFYFTDSGRRDYDIQNYYFIYDEPVIGVEEII